MIIRRKNSRFRIKVSVSPSLGGLLGRLRCEGRPGNEHASWNPCGSAIWGDLARGAGKERRRGLCNPTLLVECLEEHIEFWCAARGHSTVNSSSSLESESCFGFTLLKVCGITLRRTTERDFRGAFVDQDSSTRSTASGTPRRCEAGAKVCYTGPRPRKPIDIIACTSNWIPQLGT